MKKLFKNRLAALLLVSFKLYASSMGVFTKQKMLDVGEANTTYGHAGVD